MKVIFLDFDGVLNNEPYLQKVGNYRTLDPESIDQLNRVLEATEAKSVVSSTWRYMYPSVRDLNELLESHGLPKGCVTGLTPRVLDYNVHYTRGAEIALWLERHGSIKNWVAVDDESAMEPLPSERVVKTEWVVGLQKEHADKMIEVLNG